jgi:hypothetical protein
VPYGWLDVSIASYISSSALGDASNNPGDACLNSLPARPGGVASNRNLECFLNPCPDEGNTGLLPGLGVLNIPGDAGVYLLGFCSGSLIGVETNGERVLGPENGMNGLLSGLGVSSNNPGEACLNSLPARPGGVGSNRNWERFSNP